MGKLVGLVMCLAVGATLLVWADPVINRLTSNSVTADDETPAVAVATTSVTGQASAAALPNGELAAVTFEAPMVHPRLIDCYHNLERAIQQLKTVDCYTARWVRRIRKYGSLRDEEYIDIKIRHEPFGVHMQWLDGSQQVLFVEGQSDNKLLAHKTRGFASLKPSWRLPPESRLALKNSRYPVTQLGMLRLAERLLRIVREFPSEGAVDVELTTLEFEGRPCIRQFVKFGSPTEQPEYAQSDLLIDEETMALVSITNHGWTDGGSGSELTEHYRYENINWDAPLTDSDFDEHNERYPFSR